MNAKTRVLFTTREDFQSKSKPATSNARVILYGANFIIITPAPLGIEPKISSYKFVSADDSVKICCEYGIWFNRLYTP